MVDSENSETFKTETRVDERGNFFEVNEAFQAKRPRFDVRMRGATLVVKEPVPTSPAGPAGDQFEPAGNHPRVHNEVPAAGARPQGAQNALLVRTWKSPEPVQTKENQK